MIAGIISTIIMALGIATGNVSSNVYKGGNVFHDEEKQPKPKKATTESYNEEIPISIVDTYERRNNNNVLLETGYKYYLDDGNNQTDPTSTLVLPNMIINNTFYTGSYRLDNDTGNYEAIVCGVMYITNIFAGASKFTIKADAYLSVNNRYCVIGARNYLSTDERVSQMIDVTLTTGFAQRLDALRQTVDKTEINNNRVIGTYNTNVRVQNETTEITLLPGQSTYVIMWQYIATNTTDVMWATIGYANESGINISSQYIDQQINYEVIDLPSVMFTVLTMPFSFISTAFNLTIFPGTQYQVNFANLFMVLLASFILAWLIKKVFH